MNDFSSSDIAEALKISRTGIWRLEVEEGKHTRLFANSIMNELIGIGDDASPEECFDIFFDRIHQDDIKAFTEYNDKLFNSEKAEIVYRYHHPEKGIVYVRCGGMRDNSISDFICFRGFHQDITETVMIEKKAEVYRNIAIGMMEKFTDIGAVIDLNQNTFETVYYQDEHEIDSYSLDIVFKEIEKLVDENCRREFVEKTRPETIRAKLKNNDRYSFITFFKNPKEELRRKTIFFYVIDGLEDKYFTFIQDTTEDYLREQALADALGQANQASYAKTAFLNNMSHEIRTPLNAIIGFTGMAENNLQDRELCSEYLSKVTGASNHLLSLLNDVLDMSRIESGKVSLTLSECSLFGIMNEINNLLMADVKSHGLSFCVEASSIDNDHVMCDKLRLKQILLNCASNSIKFTPEGGHVSIKLRQTKVNSDNTAEYVFTVSDDGIGMTEEFLKSIFEPFHRADAIVGRIQGTGLGMSITKNLVDMMHGTINIRSTVNKGTEITIRLKFKLTEESECSGFFTDSEAEEESKCKECEADFRGRKILIVEDNLLNLEIAEAMIKETGASTECAANGCEAIDRFVSSDVGEYDAILMDIQMPVMDGYEATKAIRSLEREDAGSIPIIAMTANAFEEDRRRALDCGMNEHIPKPVNFSELKYVLKKKMRQ